MSPNTSISPAPAIAQLQVQVSVSLTPNNDLNVRYTYEYLGQQYTNVADFAIIHYKIPGQTACAPMIIQFNLDKLSVEDGWTLNGAEAGPVTPAGEPNILVYAQVDPTAVMVVDPYSTNPNIITYHFFLILHHNLHKADFRHDPQVTNDPSSDPPPGL